jgi:hypothetical protein
MLDPGVTGEGGQGQGEPPVSGLLGSTTSCKVPRVTSVLVCKLTADVKHGCESCFVAWCTRLLLTSLLVYLMTHLFQVYREAL